MLVPLIPTMLIPDPLFLTLVSNRLSIHPHVTDRPLLYWLSHDFWLVFTLLPNTSNPPGDDRLDWAFDPRQSHSQYSCVLWSQKSNAGRSCRSPLPLKSSPSFAPDMPLVRRPALLPVSPVSQVCYKSRHTASSRFTSVRRSSLCTAQLAQAYRLWSAAHHRSQSTCNSVAQLGSGPSYCVSNCPSRSGWLSPSSLSASAWSPFHSYSLLTTEYCISSWITNKQANGVWICAFAYYLRRLNCEYRVFP